MYREGGGGWRGMGRETECIYHISCCIGPTIDVVLRGDPVIIHSTFPKSDISEVRIT